MPTSAETKQYMINCPMCRGQLMLVTEMCYEIPNFGIVYFFSALCQQCGFKHSDVMEISPHQEPSRFIVKVEKPEDLGHIVVRSSHASIKMPELGIAITPGPYAQGMITTIEGFLYRAKEIVELLHPDELSQDQRKRCSEILEKITSAINGREAFTFIIEDPSGLSAIIPKQGVSIKIIKEPLRIED